MTVEIRAVVVLLHPERFEALEAATAFMSQIPSSRSLNFSDDMERPRRLAPGADLKPADGRLAELTVVFGGDGILLRATEWARPLDIPLLGVNPGYVGFPAEPGTSDLTSLPQAVIDGYYETEQRLVLRIDVTNASGKILWSSLVVNEVSLEKLIREKMLNVLAHVDAHSLSRWECDGVLVITPTGSTTYVFSDGGLVVWSKVQVILLVPLSAHVLFNRPMVFSSNSHVFLGLGGPMPQGIIWCDGRRSFEVESGQRVAVRTSGRPLRLARPSEQHFTARLVWKFKLSIDGWRRPPRRRTC